MSVYICIGGLFKFPPDSIVFALYENENEIKFLIDVMSNRFLWKAKFYSQAEKAFDIIYKCCVQFFKWTYMNVKHACVGFVFRLHHWLHLVDVAFHFLETISNSNCLALNEVAFDWRWIRRMHNHNCISVFLLQKQNE